MTPFQLCVFILSVIKMTVSSALFTKSFLVQLEKLNDQLGVVDQLNSTLRELQKAYAEQDTLIQMLNSTCSSTCASNAIANGPGRF